MIVRRGLSEEVGIGCDGGAGKGQEIHDTNYGSNGKGILQFEPKEEGKRKTKRGVGKRARKEDSSSSNSEEDNNTSGSAVEVEARVVKSVRKSGGDDNSHPHRAF